MALFGPRLDRPTALGDDGRPRATSLTIASLLVFALLVVATTCPWRYGLRFDGLVPSLVVPACAGLGQLALGLATTTGLLTAGLALLSRERLASLFMGQIVFLPAGTALVGGLGILTVTSPAYGLFFTGFAVAMVALGSTWADSASASSIRPALFQEGLTYVSILLWAVFAGLLYLAVLLVRYTVDASPEPTFALVLFLLYVFASSVCFRIGLRWLPIRELTPSDRRPALDRYLGWLRRANTILLVLSVLGVIVAILLGVLGVLSTLYGVAPPVAVLFGLLVSAPVVVTVFGSGLLPLVLGVAALLLRRITRPVDASANRLLAPLLAGLVLTIGMLPFTFSLLPIPLPVGVVVLVVVLGPIVLYLLGGSVVVGDYLSVLPGRAGGPALAAAGTILATIGAGLVNLPTPVVLAAAAVAMLVWDVSAYGLGVTAELGHMPETRRLELFHALVGLGVGVAVVTGLGLLGVLRQSLAGETPVLAAAALAVLGVLVSLVPLRGYGRR